MTFKPDFNRIKDMANTTQLETVVVPKRLFSSMIEAQKKWEEFSSELEDFLLSSDKRFIKKMEKTRDEHLAGKVRGLQDLKQEMR